MEAKFNLNNLFNALSWRIEKSGWIKHGRHLAWSTVPDLHVFQLSPQFWNKRPHESTSSRKAWPTKIDLACGQTVHVRRFWQRSCIACVPWNRLVGFFGGRSGEKWEPSLTIISIGGQNAMTFCCPGWRCVFPHRYQCVSLLNDPLKVRCWV